MTLVERHFDFGGFLCREDAEEIAIEDGFGAGGRRGEERKEKGRKKKKRNEICGGETRVDSREREGMDRDRQDRQDKTGQDRETLTDRPGTAKPNSGTVLLPNELKRQCRVSQQFGYIIPLSFFPALFHKSCKDKKK